uniref:Putative vacuolar protein sorting-associated protein 35 n=1 Tax=Helianthus annuus TaxID=4232 RepID=A0A251UH02_HELAN
MTQLVKVHRNIDLGMKLPVYDERRALYTAGRLPFIAKEFTVTIEDDIEWIDGHLSEVRSSIRAHDPSSSDDVLGALRKSLIWLLKLKVTCRLLEPLLCMFLFSHLLFIFILTGLIMWIKCCWYGPCLKILSNKPKLEDSRATKQVVALLSAPLEKYSDIFTSLTLSNYSRVMDHLDSGTNKIMAMVIIQSIMTNQACVSSVDKVDALFELTKGLIKDLEGDSDDEFFTTFSVATKSRFRLRVFLIKGSRIWLLTWTR